MRPSATRPVAVPQPRDPRALMPLMPRRAPWTLRRGRMKRRWCAGLGGGHEGRPAPVHGNNTAAAACPFQLILLLAAAAAVPTLSNGCKRERPISTGMFLSVYTCTLLVCILCTRDMLYALSLYCRSLIWRHHACIMGWDKKLFDFFWRILWGVCVRVRGICVVLISLFLFTCFGIV
ncbi:hypothetical protein TcCL_NonESM11640 [Trypanosoma cruzi]|uniref:Uncharacterized protein n=1 Tax=Trypanosoma cruzi (strain CL Brener) TaxID=353153 RepID=Q4E3E6_TRYCC|nr:hypothetical protein Tc00.1047053507071.110 [Trypanosoma cruzi]EAN99288.1 hypothetical protein Tc00.1047053507071.110 [Trypanosoma cruzi]RNC39055.1 hypothetical protein TcCL_NonESM11640 [Trypanosoma cruzi]|eukprot:XP_821139.1 hypothetical protein [Trypanosoma cruzi strain CL Brener]